MTRITRMILVLGKSALSVPDTRFSRVSGSTLEETQLIDLTPVDTALEAITRLLPAGVPIIRSWSAADKAFCISNIVGYVVTLTLAFLLHKQVKAVQESFKKCM